MKFIKQVAGYGFVVAIVAIMAVALLLVSPAEKSEAAASGDSPSYGGEQVSFTLVVERGGAQIPDEATLRVAAITVETLNGAVAQLSLKFTFDEQGQLVPAVIDLTDADGSSGLQFVATARNGTLFSGDADVIAAIMTSAADEVQATTPTSSTTIGTGTNDAVFPSSSLLASAPSVLGGEPAPAGNAGLVTEGSTSLWFVMALGVLALATLAGARVVTGRER